MRATLLLAPLLLAAAPALAQQSGTAPVGGTAVRALGTAGATIAAGATKAAAETGGTSAEAGTESSAAAGSGASGGSDPAAETAAAAGTGAEAGAQGGAAASGTAASGTAASATAASGTAVSGPVELRTIIGDKPIEVPAEKATEPFEQFRQTGQNPFAGDEAALAEGKKLYAKLCQACHLPDGAGRIGPSLKDDQWRHPRLDTEAGRFEIIHSGGAGAMQAFHNRMSIDEILKVMAYIDTFRQG